MRALVLTICVMACATWRAPSRGASVQDGAVRIDWIDVRALGREDLRSKLGYVEQDALTQHYRLTLKIASVAFALLDSMGLRMRVLDRAEQPA